MTAFSAGLKRAWDYNQPRDQWHPITQDDADYCLEVLPPIYFRGGFAVSEPAIHDAQGRPVYLCVRRLRGEVGQCIGYEARLAAIAEVELKAAGFHWSRPSWYGPAAKLPARFTEGGAS